MFTVALHAHRSGSRGCPGRSIHFRVRPPYRKKRQHPSRPAKNLINTKCGRQKHGHTHRGTAPVPLILPARVVQFFFFVELLRFLQALSSTGAITTDVRGVTERCFFDRRHGCSGSWGSRRCCSSTSSGLRTSSCKPRPRSWVVLQKQNSSSSTIGSLKTAVGKGDYLRRLNARIVNTVCGRQRSIFLKTPSPSGLKKRHKKPPRATPSPSKKPLRNTIDISPMARAWTSQLVKAQREAPCVRISSYGLLHLWRGGTRQTSPSSLWAECAGCLRTSSAEGSGRSAAGSA